MPAQLHDQAHSREITRVIESVRGAKEDVSVCVCVCVCMYSCKCINFVTMSRCVHVE